MESSAIKEGAIFIGDNGNMLLIISAVNFRKRSNHEDFLFRFHHKEIPETLPLVYANILCIDKDGMLKKRELSLGHEDSEGLGDDGVACALTLLQEREARHAKKKDLRDFFKRAKKASKEYHKRKISDLIAEDKRKYGILQKEFEEFLNGLLLKNSPLWFFHYLSKLELKSSSFKEYPPDFLNEF